MTEFAHQSKSESYEKQDEDEVDHYVEAKLIINKEKSAITYLKRSILPRSLL